MDGWFLPGHRQTARHKPAAFFHQVHEELTKSWHAPYSTSSSTSATLSSVGGAAEKGYETLPPLEEAVAAHLCPPTAAGWRARAVHPSRPCRSTSALAGRAFSADLALRMTKATAQAIGRGMANLIVLERHLCLNLTDIKETDRTAFFGSPGLQHWPLRPSCKGVRGVFHRGTEVITSYATLPAKILQFCF